MDEFLAPGEFQERDTFLGRSAGDDEKIGAVAFGEAPVAFGKVCGDRERSAIQLIDQKVIAAREGFGQCDNALREVGRLLIDVEVFEKEGRSTVRHLNR